MQDEFHIFHAAMPREKLVPAAQTLGGSSLQKQQPSHVLVFSPPPLCDESKLHRQRGEAPNVCRRTAQSKFLTDEAAHWLTRMGGEREVLVNRHGGSELQGDRRPGGKDSNEHCLQDWACE